MVGAEGPQDKEGKVDGVVPELAFEGQVRIWHPEITRKSGSSKDDWIWQNHKCWGKFG